MADENAAAQAEGEARDRRIAAFLDQAGWGGARRSPLAGDASNRRYERLALNGAGPARRAVLMDAPPARGEDVRPFAALTGHLRESGFSAPEIYAADLEAGALLLEDLGDDLFARAMAAEPDREPFLYQIAVDLLVELQSRPAPARVAGAGAESPIAPYSAAVLGAEARLFIDWYAPAAAGAPLEEEIRAGFDAALGAVCAEVAHARSTLVLRDYHAENLMWLPDRTMVRRVGLLDYQDALIGHPAYDLVSLLEDARRDVPRSLAEAMLSRYEIRAGVAPADRPSFRAAYAALGAQRNLKIIGIFARLWRRDGKPKYLGLIPRVWAYLQRDLAHAALAPLADWMAAHAPAPTPERMARLAAPADAAEPSLHAAAAPPPPALDTVMVLAAGLGTRMKPLTDHRPKPLIEVAGRTLLDHALDRAAAAGARRAVVNAFYLADMVRDRLAARAEETPAFELAISDETGQLMETGGGVKHALPLIDRDAFLVVNSDNLWAGANPLRALIDAWRPDAMDALLLLCPKETALGYTRAGDFSLDPDGRLIRRGTRPEAPLVYTGAQIIRRSAFDAAPDGPFSLNVVWDQLIAAGRAYGAMHVGAWVDVGTPSGLPDAERVARDGAREAAA